MRRTSGAVADVGEGEVAQPDRGPVGVAVPRLDGWAKVTGTERFLDDLDPAGQWLGGTLRSEVARGRLRGVQRDPGFDWSRVVVVTAADLPGPNVVAMIEDDYPILAADEIRYATQPLALVAAPDREILTAALQALTPLVDPLPPVLGVEQALRADTVIWGEDNVIAEYRLELGDPAAGFAAADCIIEGTYRTGHQEHIYLEPQAMLATPRTDGGVELLGSLQCPYYVHRALTTGLALPAQQVVVRQAPTGGAFGGKEDYPSVLALHAAVLALRSGRPVRMVYDRHEDILATTKRHPSVVRHRSGVDRNGRLVALDVDLILDAGACASLSAVVLQRAVLHAAGPYRVPHVTIRGRAVATSTPPNGAFRGFGVPQALFAAERQMDRIARDLQLDPIELRRRNLIQQGDVLPCGQVLKESVGAALVLERVLDLAGERPPARPASDPRRHGRGLALFFHGGGFTGGGESRIAARVQVRLAEDGVLELLTSNVEMGQGAGTTLPMIAAQALGLPLDRVRHVQPDTSVVPDSGPTVASRTTVIVGRLVLDACRAWLTELERRLADRHGVSLAEIECGEHGLTVGGRDLGSLLECAAQCVTDSGPLLGEARFQQAPGLHWDNATFRGDAYAAYSWGACVVDVEVDTDTYSVQPLRAAAVVEIGRAVHPVLAAGQVEGGLLQSLGWGYLEEMQVLGGRYLNDRLATYIIPTAPTSWWSSPSCLTRAVPSAPRVWASCP
jgi:CO/xanthine dehydrogenase Mo-binding subunit